MFVESMSVNELSSVGATQRLSLLRSSGVFVACVRSILRLVSNHHSIPIIIEYWMLDIRYCCLVLK